MPSDDIYTWIRAERLGLADFLDQLDDREWRTDSLCPGWTVHDVAAHLTLATRVAPTVAIRAAIRAGGNFNRMTANMARERASRFDRAALTAQLRQSASSTRRMVRRRGAARDPRTGGRPADGGHRESRRSDHPGRSRSRSGRGETVTDTP